jgi:hypothetical protein
MENESAERTILAERGISAPSTNQNSREILYKVELSLTLANFEVAHRLRGTRNIGSFSTIS